MRARLASFSKASSTCKPTMAVRAPCDLATIANSGSISAQLGHHIEVLSSTSTVLFNQCSSELLSAIAAVEDVRNNTMTSAAISGLIGPVQEYLVHEVIMGMLSAKH